MDCVQQGTVAPSCFTSSNSTLFFLGEVDFGALNGAQIQFPSSGVILCHNVTIVGDDIIEDIESFQVTLTPTAARDKIEGNKQINITITDDVDSKFHNR